MNNKRNPKNGDSRKQNEQNTQRQADLSPLNNSNKVEDCEGRNTQSTPQISKTNNPNIQVSFSNPDLSPNNDVQLIESELVSDQRTTINYIN